MRKNLKKNLLEIIKTIYEAHNELEKLQKKDDLKSFANLLGDCQDAALNVGNSIIKSETEDCITVAYVEQYCKSLFDIYTKIIEGVWKDDSVKILNHDLTLIKKSIEKDIIAKLEIVFMPYKASMWDSLESVWKAADEDPECDAYVVPIPYYDRNPDHSFGEFHYEGNEYPDYVPVTHYDSYDISKRKPDIIYIHNPYDDCNYVTSVDPRFYSRELKKYTNKLVYIPYFVLAEINPDDVFLLQKMSHFVLSPGVINSDEVIVQSENMKRAYINILLKEYGDTEDNRKKLEQKIMGTGSPKFEKIANISESDIQIPNEWKQIIYKPDGTRKKVVFYNNGIGALLENGDKIISKMRSVFNVFYEYKDDIVLLWRPHPLINATLESMMPYLCNEYKKLIAEYKLGNWGIYDDSCNLERAIVLSDAYFGDRSSVVQLFNTIQKPVMIQNADIIYDEDYNGSISPSAYCIDSNNMWIVHSYLNAIFKYSFKENKVYYLGMIPNEKKSASNLFSGVHKYKNKLIFVPCWGENITFLNTNNNLFSVINENKKRTGRFVLSYIKGSYLYCIPLYEDYIIKIDMENERIIKKIEWRGKFYDKSSYINNAFHFENLTYCIVPDKRDSVLVMNQNDELSVIELKGNNDRFTTGCIICDSLYLFSSNTGNIYKFNKHSLEPVLTLNMLDVSSCVLSNLCNRWLIQEDYCNKMLCVYDTKKDVIYQNNNMKSEIYNNEYKYGIVYENYYYDRHRSKLIEVHNEKIIEYNILAEIDQLHAIYMKEFLSSNEELMENQLQTISAFLDILRSDI